MSSGIIAGDNTGDATAVIPFYAHLATLAFDRGITEGRTIPKADEPSRQIHNQYVMIFHREPSGVWKIARLIWNAAEPAGV